MSLIGDIAGVPLFTTVEEALAWASANGLTGYHTHNLQGQQGFMGGVNHQLATGMSLNSNAPTQSSSRQTTTRRTRAPRRTTRAAPLNQRVTAAQVRVTPTPVARRTNVAPPSSGSSGGGY